MMLSNLEYLWPFDSTYQDLSLTFNAIPMNGVGFNSSTITGHGSSLSLSSTLNQSVIMDFPFLNLSGHSWTFETWIYFTKSLNSTEYPIVTQYEAMTLDKYLFIGTRFGKMYMGFYNDDLAGVTSLLLSTWYHVAYVFDSNSLNQSIYLNGVLDNSRTANYFYSGNNGSLVVGARLDSTNKTFFDGLIDQLYYTNRTKTSAEILDDATLTLYFSFDNGSVYDGGPLHINGSLFGSVSFVAGQVGDALQIGPSANSYFRVSGLVLLGVSKQSYSMSIWIKPSIINSSCIVYVTKQSNGMRWCLGMLGLNSVGQLSATSWAGAGIYLSGPTLTPNNWTHAAVTYSTLHGLRLYVNGNLSRSSSAFSYSASGVPDYLFLGSSLSVTGCTGTAGQFFGALDEFRLYSRELTASDVVELFNS